MSDMKKWMKVVTESNDSFDSEHSAENLVNYYDEENPDFGDPIDLEFSNKLAIGGTINTVDEDHCVIDIDSTAMEMLEDLNVIDTTEGYEILPKMDRDKYQERDGLEGPIMTRSGKVLYYDPKAGNYLDPDKDMYITYNQWKEYDSPRKAESKEDEDTKEKLKALDDIKKDPHTANDPELKKELMKRTAELKAKLGEGFEEDEVKAMLASYPEDAEKLKQTGQLDTNSQLYMDLFGYYQDEMPYGTQKARDGDPTEWLETRLDDLGFMESINEAEEKPYICVHADKGKHECHATSSYGAAKKAAEHWGMKSTAGIDAHLAVDEAEYQGKKVTLNKPIRTGKDEPKKFKVYVKDGDKVKLVRFGHQGKGNEKTMKIKKSDPARRKSFRARHNCSNPGPKTKARYWSCRAW